MAKREEFLKQRLAGIGGSDIGAILGVNKWKSPVDVWLEKTGKVDRSDEMSEPAYFGIELEDFVAKEYAKRTDNKVQRINQQMQHPEHKWMLTNIDRAVVTPNSRARMGAEGRLVGTDGILECKTASAYAASEWDGETAPLAYVAQCQWYMGVTGAAWCDLAVLIGGQNFKIVRITRDETLIEALIEQGRAFWFDCVQADIPPVARSTAETLALFPRNVDESPVIAHVGVLAALNNLKELNAEVKRLETEIDLEKSVIQSEMGEHSTLVDHQGNPLATWKCTKAGSKTDWKQAADDIKGWVINELKQPELVDDIRDIINKNTVETAPQRRFLIK